MLYGIKSSKERKEIFAFLQSEIPDLSFSNGMKQKMTSTLFNNCPNFKQTVIQDSQKVLSIDEQLCPFGIFERLQSHF